MHLAVPRGVLADRVRRLRTELRRTGSVLGLRSFDDGARWNAGLVQVGETGRFRPAGAGARAGAGAPRSPRELCRAMRHVPLAVWIGSTASSALSLVCVQRALPPGYVADAIVGKLAAFCDLMLDGHRLRSQYLSRLKTAQGWMEYLNALVTLHFPDGQAAPCALSGSGPSSYPALAKVLYGRPN